MTTAEEVKKLAALARISVAEGELERFTKEFDAILAYVSQLDQLDLPRDLQDAKALRNVMREDGAPHAKGEWTERLAAQFPDREGDYLKVKQIITHE